LQQAELPACLVCTNVLHSNSQGPIRVQIRTWVH
jgi:hypothetical protein